MDEVIDARFDARAFADRLSDLCASIDADRWVLLWREGDHWCRVGRAGTRDELLARVAATVPGTLDCVTAQEVAMVGPRLAAAGLGTLSAITLESHRPAVAFFEEPRRLLVDHDDVSTWFEVALDVATELADAAGLMAWAPDLVDLGAGKISPGDALSLLVDHFGFTAAVFAAPARNGVFRLVCDGSAPPAVPDEQRTFVSDWPALAASPASALRWLDADRPSADWVAASTGVDATSMLAVEGRGEPFAQLGLVTDLFGAAVQRFRSAEELRERVRLDERTRLAATLHEELSQQLAALTIEIDLLASREGAVAVADDLTALRRGVVGALESLRSAIFELTPPEPDWTKLDVGLERFVVDLAASRDLRVDYVVDGDPHPVDPDAVSVIFAVVQEALSNVAKHAGTTRARVHVEFVPEAVKLTIADDGAGLRSRDFEGVDLAHQGLGLLRTRARLAGASFQIGDDCGSGTVVRLEVPTTPSVEITR